MIAINFFEQPARLLAWFYSLTHDYILSISMIALVVMLLTAPLVLKSTKGMLEMQKLQPEMKKLQNLYRNDRQKLNEEMMKLYQQHKVNPLASCLPLLLQMPVFFIMFRVLHGLTEKGADGTFAPKYLNTSSELYQSLVGETRMMSWGLDLARTPMSVITESFGEGIIYALLVFALFKLIPVTLTLPGIAGFVLSVGMAVDANVLIFERMKEELRGGRNLRAAIDTGFARAWPSIRDSNASTLITCLILFWFGSNFGASIVKGFALTLAIGVLVSLFTAITVTRTFLHLVMNNMDLSRNHWWFGV